MIEVKILAKPRRTAWEGVFYVNLTVFRKITKAVKILPKRAKNLF